MTPFAKLGDMRKEAANNTRAAKLLDRLLRGAKGAVRAPVDLTSAVIGLGSNGLKGALTSLAKRDAGLSDLGDAGFVGNVLGHAGILGGVLGSGTYAGGKEDLATSKKYNGPEDFKSGLDMRKKEASSVESDERTIRRERDEKALRNRHIALALKRAIQGGLVGAGVGGIGAAKEEGGMDGGEGAFLGLLSGGLAGAGIGAAEGGIKRALGLDPTLQTFLTAQRA